MQDKSPCNTPDLNAKKSGIQQFVQSKNFLYLLTHKMNLINRQSKHTTLEFECLFPTYGSFKKVSKNIRILG